MLHGLGFVIPAIALVIVLKAIINWLTPYNDEEEIVTSDNTAASLSEAGPIIGLAIALAGVLNGAKTPTWQESLTTFIVEGIVALLLIVIMLLATGARAEAMRERTASMALVNAAMFIAIGAIIAASFAHTGGGLASAITFSVLGTAVLGLTSALQTRVAYSAEAGAGNMAAGVILASELLAFGAIIASSIIGPFAGWYEDFVSFFRSATTAYLVLFVVRIIVHRLLLPGSDLYTEIVRDKSVASAIRYATVATIAAIIASTLV
ncbi:MAG: DUF350 domain-containing protein [Patescibacteria group bacterium]|jgi:uncharacterized membrane protein YjfL (UPF0719 family)